MARSQLLGGPGSHDGEALLRRALQPPAVRQTPSREASSRRTRPRRRAGRHGHRAGAPGSRPADSGSAGEADCTRGPGRLPLGLLGSWALGLSGSRAIAESGGRLSETSRSRILGPARSCLCVASRAGTPRANRVSLSSQARHPFVCSIHSKVPSLLLTHLPGYRAVAASDATWRARRSRTSPTSAALASSGRPQSNGG